MVSFDRMKCSNSSYGKMSLEFSFFHYIVSSYPNLNGMIRMMIVYIDRMLIDDSRLKSMTFLIMWINQMNLWMYQFQSDWVRSHDCFAIDRFMTQVVALTIPECYCYGNVGSMVFSIGAIACKPRPTLLNRGLPIRFIYYRCCRGNCLTNICASRLKNIVLWLRYCSLVRALSAKFPLLGEIL
jgi:hypothetical protein